MSQWQGPPPQDPYGQGSPSGPHPQDPYGQQAPYGPGAQGTYGPGAQGPYGPGAQGPYGPQAPGPYGYPQQQPYPPPPRSSNSGILWAVGVVAVVVLVGAVSAVVILVGSGGSKPPKVAQSAPAVTPSAQPLSTDTPEPTTSTPTGSTGSTDLSGVLTPTVKAALRGNTYTRLSTQGGSCSSKANAALKKVLKAHPCSAPVTAALYRNPDKSVRISVFIMQFATRSDAAAVSKATNSQASPGLISAPRRGAGYWTTSRTTGSRVVYAVACRANGGTVGTSTGPVNSAARELGVEIATVLIFKT